MSLTDRMRHHTFSHENVKVKDGVEFYQVLVLVDKDYTLGFTRWYIGKSMIGWLRNNLATEMLHIDVIDLETGELLGEYDSPEDLYDEYYFFGKLFPIPDWADK